MNPKLETEELHVKGNTAFKDGDYTTAVSLYSAAIDADPSNHVFCLNRSMANLKLEDWSHAEDDANKALEISPKEIKGFYRRAFARREQGNFSGAEQDIKSFSELGGESTTAARELDKIPRFEVKDAGVKGLGAFALRQFRRGDLILSEAPLFSIHHRDGERHASQEAVLSAINKLPPEKLRLYGLLRNAHAEARIVPNPLTGIYYTNSFQMDQSRSGIFMQASRFNHSCSPNARYSYNLAVNRFRIYALCDIACGDEISVSYISSRSVYGSTRVERQARLSRYAFTCSCAVCDLPALAASASDDRRTEVNDIWESVPHFAPNQTWNRLLAIKRAIRLLQEENYFADYDDFTNDAAAICAFHSDWASAKYWAAKTYETRVAEFGEDSHRAKEVKGTYYLNSKSGLAGRGPRQTFDVRL